MARPQRRPAVGRRRETGLPATPQREAGDRPHEPHVCPGRSSRRTEPAPERPAPQDPEGAVMNPLDHFDQEHAQQAVRALLVALGEDPDREGLQETPRRVASMFFELCTRKEFTFTTFASEGMDQMVVQSNIPLQSLCEHHMLPFIGSAAVAYIPNGRIVGLSKLARAVHY